MCRLRNFCSSLASSSSPPDICSHLCWSQSCDTTGIVNTSPLQQKQLMEIITYILYNPSSSDLKRIHSWKYNTTLGDWTKWQMEKSQLLIFLILLFQCYFAIIVVFSDVANGGKEYKIFIHWGANVGLGPGRTKVNLCSALEVSGWSWISTQDQPLSINPI